MIRSLALALALGLALGLWARASATAVDPNGHCRPPSGATVVKRSGDGLLYRTRTVGGRRGSLYGCWRPTGRRTLLVKPRSDGELEPFADTYNTLAGRWALVETTEGARFGPEWKVFVADLRRGRLGPSVPSMTFESPTDQGARRAIQRAVISPQGDAAWTVRNYFTDPRRREVYKLEDGTVTRLDDGPNVDTSSLRLRARRLRWTSDGAARSALLG